MSDDSKNILVDKFKEDISNFGGTKSEMIDEFGDIVQSGSNIIGYYSNNALDSIAERVQAMPYPFAKSLAEFLDKVGDLAESFFINGGAYLNRQIDSYADHTTEPAHGTSIII